MNNLHISILTQLKNLREIFSIVKVNKYKRDATGVIKFSLSYLSENEEKFSFLKSTEIFIDLHLINDKQIEKINFQYRGKKESTNVVSFSYFNSKDFANQNFLQPLFLGEIFISMETLITESKEQGIIIEYHFFRLLIHGLLHLLGFDHIMEFDARLMYNMEENILNKLKLPTNSIVANYWR